MTPRPSEPAPAKKSASGSYPPARRGFTAAYEAFVEETDLASLRLDPDAIFDSVRDRSPGREVDL